MAFRRSAILVFCAALVYAPFAHGCVTDEDWRVLDGILLVAALLHLLGLTVERRMPRVPRVVWGSLGFLVGYAVLQTLNPAFEFDPVTGAMSKVGEHLEVLPGTMDQRTSANQLLHGGALGLAFLALLDWTRSRRERWFLLGTMTLCGAAVAVFGVVLKMQGAKQVPWSEVISGNFFASFVYHGHAAAFLGLCWPAALVLAIRSLAAPDPVGRALWINLFLLLFAALFLNLSKFGHFAALPGLAVALILARRGLRVPGAGVSPVVVIVGGGLVLGTLVMLVAPFWGASAVRWEQLLASGEGGRPFIYRVCLDIIRSEPWFGCGTGSFRWVFPFYTGSYENSFGGTVTHAHQDFLQTVVEWGLVGSVGWLVLAGGGYLRGWRMHLRQPTELGVVAALVALGTTFAHGMADFPFQTGVVRLYAAVYLAILWRVRPDRREAE